MNIPKEVSEENNNPMCLGYVFLRWRLLSSGSLGPFQVEAETSNVVLDNSERKRKRGFSRITERCCF
jgi:hypothetical protein